MHLDGGRGLTAQYELTTLPFQTADTTLPSVEAPLPEVLLEREPAPAPTRRPPNAAFGLLRRLRDFWFGQTDLAPLALLRIVYGLLLFVWLAQLLPNLDAFFTDEGIIPRSELVVTDPSSFTLLAAVGLWWQVVIFWLGSLIVAVMLAVGYRTRLACGLVFLALISFEARNSLIVDSSDFVFKLIPFWMMFTAAGERYSVDALLRRRQGKPSRARGPAFPIRILELQLGWIYLATGLEKWVGGPWRNGTAMYYVLQLSHSFSRPFASSLAFNSGVVRGLTWEALAVEMAFLPLIFLPGLSRLIAVFTSALLQLGILVMMNVGNFPLIMLGMLALFLPGAWVQWAFAKFGKVGRWPRVLGQGSYLAPEPPPARGKWRTPAAHFALAALAAASLGMALPPRFSAITPPAQVRNVLYFAGLDQTWRMFAPQPSNYDWWAYAPAQLSNGATFDLFTHQPPTRDPHDWGPFYDRWMKASDLLVSSSRANYLLEYGRGICRVYNNHLGPGQPALETFQIYMEERWIQPPGQGPAKTDERLLWDHHCF